MRIALVCADIRPNVRQGGIATYVGYLADGLAARGHEMTILGQGQALSEETLASGVKIVYLPAIPHWEPHKKLKPLTDKLARSRTVASYLVANPNFDIVEFPIWDAEGLHGTKLDGFKSVVHGHTPHSVVNELTAASGAKVAKMDKLASMLEARSARQANLYLANSYSAMETAIERFHLKREKCKACLLGMPMPDSLANPPESPIRVLFVGRLETRKGINELLQAIPQVLAKHPETVFDIVGIDGSADSKKSFEQVFQKSQSETVAKQVVFHGRLGDEDLLNLRMQTHIAALPSLSESFGFVHTEAMSFGTPVVAFDIAATREVVDNGKTGFLVPAGDVNALSESISRLIEDRALREEMGKVAAKEMRENFSIEAMAECIEGAYASLLDS